MCIPKWKANVTVTINAQVLAFGQKPSRKTAPGYSVGEEPAFHMGSAVWWMNTCELHYIDSAKSVQIMKALGSFVRMAFLVFEILRIILFIFKKYVLEIFL